MFGMASCCERCRGRGRTSGWDMPAPPTRRRRPVFSPDGQMLAVVTRDRVLLWNLQSGALRRELQGLGSSVGPLTFTPDGSRLIAGRGEIWDVGSGGRTAQFEK